jgi:hypothetical protein
MTRRHGNERIRRERGGDVTVAFDPAEAVIVRAAFADLMALLDERSGPPEDAAPDVVPGVPDPFLSLGATGSARPPEDPALARLLPDAYHDDPDASADFRRFTEPDLVAGKQANIRTVLATLGDGGRIRLDQDALRAWLYALNDLRLALGSRLGVEEGYEEMLAAMEPGDPRLPGFALYEWLTSLQDALVQTQLSGK